MNETDNILAGIAACKKTILLSQHDRQLLYHEPDQITNIARITGCVALDVNGHSRVEGAEPWTLDDSIKALALAGQVQRHITACVNDSPWLGAGGPLDPASTLLDPIGTFAGKLRSVAEVSGEEVVTVLDQECFSVHREGGTGAGDIIDDAHNARIDTIMDAFTDYALPWCGSVYHFGALRTKTRLTWRERGDNADAWFYYPMDVERGYGMARDALTKQADHSKSATTVHISLGIGYDADGKWVEQSVPARGYGQWCGDNDVVPILHPHPLSTQNGPRDLAEFVAGVNEAMG